MLCTCGGTSKFRSMIRGRATRRSALPDAESEREWIIHDAPESEAASGHVFRHFGLSAPREIESSIIRRRETAPPQTPRRRLMRRTPRTRPASRRSPAQRGREDQPEHRNARVAADDGNSAGPVIRVLAKSIGRRALRVCIRSSIGVSPSSTSPGQLHRLPSFAGDAAEETGNPMVSAIFLVRGAGFHRVTPR